MKKTVLITGCSTGIGRECAFFFLKMGWNVVAGMRNTSDGNDLKQYGEVLLVRMDVTDKESVAQAVSAAIDTYGQIDVLVNNAGYYSIGVLEAISDTEIERQINTNLTGLIRVTKEVLPYMRKRRSGRIINISSVAGRTTVPLQSIYHATKWGVEGFTESLQFELSECGIDVALVEPGVIKTDFYSRSMSFSEDKKLSEYDTMSRSVSNYLVTGGNSGSMPKEVAEKIYRIATAKKVKLHYPVGKSTGIIWLHKLMPRKLYMNAVKHTMMKE